MTDPLAGKVMEAIHTGSWLQEITVAECTVEDGQIWYRGNLYVPDNDAWRLWIIQEYHDTASTGHPDQAKTIDLLDRQYYCKGMQKDVDQSVRNYHGCQCSRCSRHSMFGIIWPLPISNRPWEDISLYLKVWIPECDGYDAIWVVVDRLLKMQQFISRRPMIDASGLAELFLNGVVCDHGLPLMIVSDRGPQFASTFWGQICSHLGIDCRLSTAFHR